MKPCLPFLRAALPFLMLLLLAPLALGSQSAVEEARLTLSQARTSSGAPEERVRAVGRSMAVLAAAAPEEASVLAQEILGDAWVGALPASLQTELWSFLSLPLYRRDQARSRELAQAALDSPSSSPETRARALRSLLTLMRVTGDMGSMEALVGQLEGLTSALQGDSLLEARATLLWCNVLLGRLSDAALGEASLEIVAQTRSSRSPLLLGAFSDAAASSIIWLPARALQLHPQQDEAGQAARASLIEETLASLASESRARIALSEELFGQGAGPSLRLYQSHIRLLVQTVPGPGDSERVQEAMRLYRLNEGQPHMVPPLDLALLLASIADRWGLAAEIAEARQIIGAQLDDGATVREAQAYLAVLGPLSEPDPAVAARRWTGAIQVFADATRQIATQSPDSALGYVQAWSLNWSFYQDLPAKGQADLFLEGYTQATGIVKNAPFAKRSADSIPGRFGPVTLDEVKKKTSAKSPLLVFVQFQDPLKPSVTRYGGFLVQGSSPVKYVDLGPSPAIDEAIAAWGRSVRGPLEEAQKGDPRQRGAALYRFLLQPFFGSTPPSRLTYVPDGIIGSLSFAALRAPSGKWLVEHTVLSSLGAVRDIVRPSLALAKGASVLSATSFAGQARLAVPVRTTAALKRAAGQVATKAFSAGAVEALAPPRYLHLSTHGLFRSKGVPGFDTQALASLLVAPGKAKDDEILAKDVASWNLRGTRLVTLAACDAAAAEALRGEGSGGLRRGLALAGARHVVGSLRPVYAENAKEAPGDAFFARLYTAIAGGRTPAEALRQAQLVTLRRRATAAPHFWAGYLIEGA